MAPHSRTLVWKIPWMEEPGGPQSMGSQRVRHNWATSHSLFTFMHWRRKWQTTPVFLLGESQGWGSLVGCCLWGRTESDTTEVMQQQQQDSQLLHRNGTDWVYVSGEGEYFFFSQMLALIKLWDKHTVDINRQENTSALPWWLGILLECWDP